MAKRYRSRSSGTVVCQAVQWLDTDECFIEMRKFIDHINGPGLWSVDYSMCSARLKIIGEYEQVASEGDYVVLFAEGQYHVIGKELFERAWKEDQVKVCPECKHDIYADDSNYCTECGCDLNKTTMSEQDRLKESEKYRPDEVLTLFWRDRNNNEYEEPVRVLSAITGIEKGIEVYTSYTVMLIGDFMPGTIYVVDEESLKRTPVALT